MVSQFNRQHSLGYTVIKVLDSQCENHTWLNCGIPQGSVFEPKQFTLHLHEQLLMVWNVACLKLNLFRWRFKKTREQQFHFIFIQLCCLFSLIYSVGCQETPFNDWHVGMMNILDCSQNEGTWTGTCWFTSREKHKMKKRFLITFRLQDTEALTGRRTSQNPGTKTLFGNLATLWAAALYDSRCRLQSRSAFHWLVCTARRLPPCFFFLFWSFQLSLLEKHSLRARLGPVAAGRLQQALWFQHGLGISLKRLHFADFY